MKQKDFSHFDEKGIKMVDVGGKEITERYAKARAYVVMKPETLQKFQKRELEKGDAIEVAKIAGIMAGKRTAELIPLCHPLPIEHIKVDFQFLPDKSAIKIEAEVKTDAKTGVEMEALIAVAIAALTIYDMGKAVDKEMTIERIELVEKWGGKSGHFIRSKDE